MIKLPTINVSVRKAVINKRGESPLTLLIFFAGRTYFKSLGVTIKPDRLKNEKVTGNDRETLRINQDIRDVVSELGSKFLAAYENNTLNHETIKDILAGNQVTDITLLQALELIKKRYGSKLKADRLNKLKGIASKFCAWRQLYIKDINKNILAEFESYLITDLGHKSTTANANMSAIKSIITKCRESGLINSDPFLGYKMIPYKNPKRDFLTKDQVHIIELLADNESVLQAVRAAASWFVFSCYSGMRHSDMLLYSEKDMIRGGKLYFSDQKEANPHFVPIYPKLKQAIERISGMKAPSLQHYNRMLKAVSAICNIETNVTSHIGRHTFAVMYLENDGTKDVLQKLMGHKKAETTAIYGQITDSRINNEVLKVFTDQ